MSYNLDSDKNSHFLIINCEKKLEQLKPHIDESEAIAVVYNKILIEKAKLKHRAKQKQKKFLDKILEKFITVKEKRICDYFKK